MSTKLKNGLVRTFTYLLSITGMILVIAFQYFTDKNPMPVISKIAVPFLLGFLVVFLVYYKSLKQKINRKLTAIETAKELGKTGRTNCIVANLLETMGIIIPLIVLGGIFMIGGQYLVKTGLVLFEILGLYTINIIGNIVCDFNTKEELKKQEEKQSEELVDKITKNIENLKRYE